MKNIKYLIILFLLPISFLVKGQGGVVVEGVVLDSLTKEPLVGASIIPDYSRESGAITDTEGRFRLILSDRDHAIAVKYLGYVPGWIYTKKGNYKYDVQIALETVSNQLEQVVITNKGFDKAIKAPILGVNQINIKTLKKMPAAFGELDILRSIQMLPGVTSVGEASNGVNIRGGTTDQNLILVDDTPIFNPTHMFGLFSVVPSDAVRNLDLYKGNVPGRYGGRAASVLDVSLVNPNLNNFEVNGGISLVSNRLMINTPIIKDKLGIYVAARGSYNDFLLPLATNRLDDISTTFGEVVTKAFWRVNQKNTLTGMAYFSDDYFETNLLTNLPNVIGTSTYFQHRTLNTMARWLTVINSKLDLQTTFIRANYNPTIATKEFETNNPVELKSNLLQTTVKSNLNMQLTKHKLETGLSFTRYNIDPGTLEPNASPSVNYIKSPTEIANELAWYADDEYLVNNKLAISLGMRYSYFMSLGPATVRSYDPKQPRDEFSVTDETNYEKGEVVKTYGGFEPRVGFRYALDDNRSFKAGYNLMRQYLQVVSNTTTPIPTSRWKTSDQHIRPQVSNLVTAGYYHNLKSGIYEFSLEAYYRITNDIIDYKPGADFLLQPFPETQLVQGQSRSYGIETMVSKKKGSMTGWLNYTYSRTLNQVYPSTNILELVNNGDWYAANYDKPHTFNTSIDIQVDKKNSFGFIFVYSTGRPYTEPVGFINYQNNFYPFYDQRNNNRIPDYHRLDFSWNISNPSKKDRRWKGKWAFTVYNLYGRKNVYSVFFRTEQNVARAYDLKIFAAPLPSLSYSFEFE